MKKLIRVTTVPISLSGLLTGQLKFMSQYFNILAISSKGKANELENISSQEGVPVKAIEMTRKITPLKDLRALWQLYILFKKEKPYIVHSHTPKAGTLSMLAAKLAGVPHRLHTIAGLPLVEANGAKRILLNTVEKITYSCATKIYPNSYGLKKIINVHNFTSEDKLEVIANGSSNGIDTSFFSPSFFNEEQKQTLKSKLGINETDFIFTFVGRLVSDKGLNELLKAFNHISKSYDHARLLLVGDFENDLDPLKESSIDILRNNQQIISTGWVNDVRPFFSISNVLVFPSYREGFPNVVMQAGAMGLPSIVSNINGCNEIIIEGENGTIIPVKNSNLLQQKMLDLLIKENKYDKTVCRELIVSRYQRQVIWDALLNEYNRL